ncbi:hypothetical protein DNTS_023475 [Danionella cerebrum]|uniref:Protein kinase domain-containing protein n=1 Tax=Danionella cerebrum TaxID=2873325 RepID=A0A553MWF4_9TELE|nr:hypothetical protein DNTS_023475 [Danionella translucida]
MPREVEASVFLFDVPPALMNTFCRLMDSGVDGLGWRDLAVRILPSQLEVRCTEIYTTAGKSPTQELMWGWAQKNKTVGDLLKVLDEMGEKWNYVITFADVIKGTNHFHPDFKIGKSSVSEVYRGWWGKRRFAVKVFKEGTKVWKVSWEKFTKEIEALQLKQHPNLLEFWGSFSDSELFYVVYPYLHNRSLFHWLHEDVEKHLSWQERLNIIKGTAKAVHHLHSAQPHQVICGNITSSNVLLDENLEAKLSDYGVAHLRPHSIDQSCTVSMDTTSHCNLGYLPEEFIRDGKLSVKLDIYSLGMVILETCTGQKVKQKSAKILFLRDMLHGEFEEKGSVDACLQFLDTKAKQWPPAVALSLLQIGLECTASKIRARPTMEIVLQRLNNLHPMPAITEDPANTFDDRIPPHLPKHEQNHRLNFPMEDDEMYSPSEEDLTRNLADPSQSYITSLSSSNLLHEHTEVDQDYIRSDPESRLDLYGSWPVECSCSSGAEVHGCDDCCANGFTSSVLFHTLDNGDLPAQDDILNPAKTNFTILNSPLQ